MCAGTYSWGTGEGEGVDPAFIKHILAQKVVTPFWTIILWWFLFWGWWSGRGREERNVVFTKATLLVTVYLHIAGSCGNWVCASTIDSPTEVKLLETPPPLTHHTSVWYREQLQVNPSGTKNERTAAKKKCRLWIVCSSLCYWELSGAQPSQ